MDPIRTSHIRPPIPTTAFDWQAYRDAEYGPFGHGPTEQEAIADLMSQEEDAE